MVASRFTKSVNQNWAMAVVLLTSHKVWNEMESINKFHSTYIFIAHIS